VSSTSPTPIRFQGPPEALEALVARPAADFDQATLSYQSDGHASSATPLVAAPGVGPLTWLYAQLAPATPPGTYQGRISTEKGELPCILHVLERHEVVVFPSMLELGVVSPGSRTHLHLTVYNNGNGDERLPRVMGLGALETEGLEEALSAAYRDPNLRGLDRVAKVADELALRHVLVRVTARNGHGVLRTGELRDLELELRWPTRMRAGRSYAGTWPIAAGQRLSARFTAAGDADTSEDNHE